MVWDHAIHGIEAMLNDAKIKAAKAKDKAYKLSDTGQLYLHVSTAGGRSWRLNYTFGRNAKGTPQQKTLIRRSPGSGLPRAGGETRPAI